MRGGRTIPVGNLSIGCNVTVIPYAGAREDAWVDAEVTEVFIAGGVAKIAVRPWHWPKGAECCYRVSDVVEVRPAWGAAA
jgi:hypothetical protein